MTLVPFRVEIEYNFIATTSQIHKLHKISNSTVEIMLEQLGSVFVCLE